MALPIALQLYTVRDILEKDFVGTLKAVKEMGYDGVEFAGLYGRTPTEIKTILADLGLVAVSAHVPYAELTADAENTLKAYKEIGCNYVAVPYMTEEYRPGAAKFEEAIANIRKIAEVAKSLGITLLYHNHDFEFVKVNGEYGLDVMYTEIPADLLETEIDTCWVKVAGEDPAAYVLKYTGRAPVVHLKDFAGERSNNMYKLIGLNEEKKEEAENKFEFRPVGHGKQDFPAIIAASEQAGAKWLVVEQDEPSMGKTRLECAEMGRAYLKTIGY
ncbi:MAG: sugar phosphate isomerase/epimerase [Clostridia bacterium]|nr:sugar phosphate isomerase/epimerase [Clostridia bacterium]